MNSWQLIETAIKHTDDKYGYAYILTDGHGVGTGFWNEALECWDWAYRNNWEIEPRGEPTHWMPFPKPPQNGE